MGRHFKLDFHRGWRIRIAHTQVMGQSPAAAASRGVPTIIKAQVLLIFCSKAADCTLETSLGVVINDK